MWHALRAELLYYKYFLAGAAAIALATTGMVNALAWFGAGRGIPSFVATGLPPLGLIIGAMVVCFIAQGTRSEERRIRLHLCGPLTPRQLAVVMVLIPTIIMGLGVLAAVLVMAVAVNLTGGLESETLRVVSGTSGQFYAIVLLGPLAQESTAAKRQRRTGSSFAGWGLFFASILALVVCQWYWHSIVGHLGHLAVAGVVMAASVLLFTHRRDFTR